jgi:hypothetical protein
MKHGHRKTNPTDRTPTYNSWRKMRERCTNPNQQGYDNYGGRGIRVDPSWQSFQQFLTDMGERPYGKTLDRVDPHKDYGSQNCRWATAKQQARNKR